MLILESIAKSYQGNLVIARAGFHLKKGEILCIKGPSGIGKTTLLKICAGLVAPDTGKVIRHTQYLGYAFQHPVFLPWKTVLENMRFVTTARDWQPESALEWLDRFELAHCAGIKPGQLSGGMKKRLGMAMALSTRPELLFLDEPFTSLDERRQNQAAKQLCLVNEKSRTTIMIVSHTLAPLQHLPARVVNIDSAPITLQQTQCQGSAQLS